MFMTSNNRQLWADINRKAEYLITNFLLTWDWSSNETLWDIILSLSTAFMCVGG